jgi:Zn-dependent protease
VLFAFGGIVLQPIELIDPKKEMHMAFAGPLISFIIFGLSFLIWFELHQSNMSIIQGFPISSIVFYSAMINLVIGLFNLLPVFPSDGGRILRSILSYRTHDQFRATISAIKIGWILSFSILIIGAARGSGQLEAISDRWCLVNACGLVLDESIQIIL